MKPFVLFLFAILLIGFSFSNRIYSENYNTNFKSYSPLKIHYPPLTSFHKDTYQNFYANKTQYIEDNDCCIEDSESCKFSICAIASKLSAYNDLFISKKRQVKIPVFSSRNVNLELPKKE